MRFWCPYEYHKEQHTWTPKYIAGYCYACFDTELTVSKGGQQEGALISSLVPKLTWGQMPKSKALLSVREDFHPGKHFCWNVSSNCFMVTFSSSCSSVECALLTTRGRQNQDELRVQLKLHLGRFRTDIKRNVFTERAIKHRIRLPRGVVESPWPWVLRKMCRCGTYRYSLVVDLALLGWRLESMTSANLNAPRVHDNLRVLGFGSLWWAMHTPGKRNYC